MDLDIKRRVGLLAKDDIDWRVVGNANATKLFFVVCLLNIYTVLKLQLQVNYTKTNSFNIIKKNSHQATLKLLTLTQVSRINTGNNDHKKINTTKIRRKMKNLQTRTN